jgi:ferredoxin
MFLGKYGAPFSMYNWEGCPPETFTAEMEAELIHKIKPIAGDHDCRIIGSVNVGTEYMEDKELYKKDVRTVLQAKPDLMEHSPACWMHIWPHPDWPIKEKQAVMDEMHFLEKEECQKLNIPTIAKGVRLNYADEIATSITKKRVEEHKKRGITWFHPVGFRAARGSGIYEEIKTTEPEYPPEIRSGIFVDLKKMEPVLPGPETAVYGEIHRAGANLGIAMAKAEGLNLMSSGGIWTVRDCIERMMCGATAVGLHTAVMYHGQQLFGKLVRGISDFLDRKGYKLDQIVGAAVPMIVSWDAFNEFMAQHEVPREALRVEIELNKCTACGLCANCFYGAMMMKNSVPACDNELCERCGICESLCAPGAITIRRV